MPMHPATGLRERFKPICGLALLVLAVAAQGAPARKTKAAAPATPAASAPSYSGRADVAAFAADLAQRQGLDEAWVRAQLAQARRIDTVARLIMPPPAGTAKNWAAYRERFVEPRRIQAGLDFWRRHESWLAQAEARFGVPAQIVVAIVGVETFYGRDTGSFRVLDALATLSFDFPTGRKDRSAFFRDELGEFLQLCKREGLQPAQVKGSFAGAMGLPQFMPGSVNRFALDFDGDGHVNLHSSGADVVGSVARFLAEHGWQRGMPTHFEVAAPVDSSQRATLLVPDILPSFSPAAMAELGAVLGEGARGHNGPLALVELQNGGAAPSYVAGTQNFYAVTRYNWSSYYALAVISLGEALAQARAR